MSSLEREAKRAAKGTKLRIQAPIKCPTCGRTVSFGRGSKVHREGRCGPRTTRPEAIL